ncbi:hypothetical protein [Nocardia sp. NPDC059691]
MNRDYAARWFGFPPDPISGEVETAFDGSVWTFSAFSPWWLLAEEIT